MTHPPAPVAKIVTVPGGVEWQCTQCKKYLKAGEKAVKVGSLVYCVECARGGKPIHRGIDPEAIETAERLGLSFDGFQEDPERGSLYQFTVQQGPEKIRGATFWVKDLTEVESRLREKYHEFGIWHLL